MSMARTPSVLTFTRLNNSSNPFSRHKTRKLWFAKKHQKRRSKRRNAKKRNGILVRYSFGAQTWGKLTHSLVYMLMIVMGTLFILSVVMVSHHLSR